MSSAPSVVADTDGDKAHSTPRANWSSNEQDSSRVTSPAQGSQRMTPPPPRQLFEGLPWRRLMKKHHLLCVWETCIFLASYWRAGSALETLKRACTQPLGNTDMASNKLFFGLTPFEKEVILVRTSERNLKRTLTWDTILPQVLLIWNLFPDALPKPATRRLDQYIHLEATSWLHQESNLVQNAAVGGLRTVSYLLNLQSMPSKHK